MAEARAAMAASVDESPLLRMIEQAERAVAEGIPLDRFLRTEYRGHRRYGSHDRRLISETLFSWFRWRGWVAGADRPIACAAAYLLDHPGLPPAIRRGLPGGHALTSAEGLAERSLEEKAERVGQWLGSVPRSLADLVPAWVPSVLGKAAGADGGALLRGLIESFQSRPPVWLRLRDPWRGAMVREFALAGLEATFHPNIAGAVSFPGSLDLAGHRGWRGRVEVQDIASQAVGLVCCPAAASSWWDVCAGSGGKALHLADLTGNGGRVLATDIRASAGEEARRRVGLAHASAVSVRRWDGHSLPPEAPFDGVLVDAPCSGLGTWHRNPDARWRTNAAAIDRHVQTQRRLMSLAAPAVARGGVLVYSTCTLTTGENTGIVENFLAEHADFVPDPFNDPVTRRPTGGLLWSWPWESRGNGMFMARLRRR